MKPLLFLVALCAGCSSSNITTEELDEALSQYDGISSADPVKPRNGAWRYTSTDIKSDTCANAIDMLDISGGFEVERYGLHFDMTLDGNSTAADCLLSGARFECEPLAESDQEEDSLALRTTVLSRGELYSTDVMEGLHELEIDCDGAGCGMLQLTRDINFPCRFGLFFTAASS